ncbi:MAG: sulfite exporter TauE/SafE family protein [Sedimentisphaerales bacterium]|nr:sulfite exporter TauE/SafE family protein [Sedimentisphaerales bacterium]
MSADIWILAITAAGIGFTHTLFGPDHYLPFIMMSVARKWSRTKTMWITFLCGLGHIGSSVVLGLIGVATGVALSKLELFESHRGDWAAWGLIVFGLLYFVWGVRRAVKNKPHTHFHTHADGDHHAHKHVHHEEHTHVHAESEKPSITPWALFVIFVLGPCEPLIPILMYPAAKHSPAGMGLVTLVFAVTTIGTMMTAVLLATSGAKKLPTAKIERYTHALAGGTICLCGLAIVFLGL